MAFTITHRQLCGRGGAAHSFRSFRIRAKGRYTRHVGDASRRRRRDAYAADVRALKPTQIRTQSRRLGPVVFDTGEIKQL